MTTLYKHMTPRYADLLCEGQLLLRQLSYYTSADLLSGVGDADEGIVHTRVQTGRLDYGMPMSEEERFAFNSVVKIEGSAKIGRLTIDSIDVSVRRNLAPMLVFCTSIEDGNPTLIHSDYTATVQISDARSFYGQISSHFGVGEFNPRASGHSPCIYTTTKELSYHKSTLPLAAFLKHERFSAQREYRFAWRSDLTEKEIRVERWLKPVHRIR